MNCENDIKSGETLSKDVMKREICEKSFNNTRNVKRRNETREEVKKR